MSSSLDRHVAELRQVWALEVEHMSLLFSWGGPVTVILLQAMSC